MRIKHCIQVMLVCGLAFTALALGLRPAVADNLHVKNISSLTIPVATLRPQVVSLDSILLLQNCGGNGQGQNGNGGGNSQGCVTVPEPSFLVQFGIGLLALVLLSVFSRRSQESRFSNR